MKKLLRVLILIFALCLCLSCFTSCFTSCLPYHVFGIENFSPEVSSLELTSVLLPSPDFLEKYEYSDGIYHYYDETSVSFDYCRERAIVVLKYDEANYLPAKEFCKNEFVLSETFIEEYKGYVFIENLSYRNLFMDDYMDDSKTSNIPNRFNVFAYNDEKCTLVFLDGLFWYTQTFRTDKEALGVLEQGWGVFLDKYYGEYYSFDE